MKLTKKNLLLFSTASVIQSFLIIAAIWILIIACSSAIATEMQTSSSKEISVLFIGNSYTHYDLFYYT